MTIKEQQKIIKAIQKYPDELVFHKRDLLNTVKQAMEVEEEEEKCKNGLTKKQSNILEDVHNFVCGLEQERLKTEPDTFCGMPVNENFFVKNSKDETIIKECLNYVSHRIDKHPHSFASHAFKEWLPRIDEMRKDFEYLEISNEDFEIQKNKYKKKELTQDKSRKIEQINENDFYKKAMEIQISILLTVVNNIIDYLNED